MNDQIEIIARHYCIAAVWADCPEGTHPRITRSAMRDARNIAQRFVDHIGAERMAMIEAAHADGYGQHPDCGTVLPWCAALGHDLYLSRAGHGTDFRDRDSLPEALRDWLADQCWWNTPMGEAEVTFSNGWMYVER